MSCRVNQASSLISGCRGCLQSRFLGGGTLSSSLRLWVSGSPSLHPGQAPRSSKRGITTFHCTTRPRRLHLTLSLSEKPNSICRPCCFSKASIASSVADGKGGVPETEAGSLSEGHQLRRNPYLKYGTHLDPAVLRQLSQGLAPAKPGGTERETFHPKLTPRLFYREDEGYGDSAVIYPRLGARSEAAEDVNRLLDRFQGPDRGGGETGPPPREVLACLLRCSDEELLGRAEDDRLLRLVSQLARSTADAGTAELVRTLTLLARVQIRTSNRALRALELECERRCRGWDVPTALLVCDAFRLIGLNATSFSRALLGQVGERLEALTKCQTVQLLYLLGESRDCSPAFPDQLQDVFLRHLDGMSLAEIGAACHGFFKSQTRLKPALVRALAGRVREDPLTGAHSFYVVSILKVFREAYFGHRGLFGHVGKALAPRLPTFPIPSVMHVLLTFATLHIPDEGLFEAGARELSERIRECRCKDVSKFLWSFATLDHRPADSARFFGRMVDRMAELLGEYEDFPVFLVSGLLSLAYLEIYPAGLINVVFSRGFLRRIEENAKQSGIDPLRDLFLLHTSVSIDCPEYKGNRLSKEFFSQKPLSRRMFGSLKYELARRPILAEVADAVTSSLVGIEHIKLGFTLPHMKTADIEIALGPNDAPIAVSRSEGTGTSQKVPLDSSLIASLSGSGHGVSTTPSRRSTTAQAPAQARNLDGALSQTGGGTPDPTSDLGDDGGHPGDRGSDDRPPSGQRETTTEPPQWEVPSPVSDDGEQVRRIAILVWSRNHFHFGGKKLLGLHAMKRRQLQKLGYQTVEIPFYEWDQLAGATARGDYIQRKIFSLDQNSI